MSKLEKAGWSILAMFIFVRCFLLDYMYVPSESMEPTLYQGDVLLVNRSSYRFSIPWLNYTFYKRRTPNRGEVIVFHPEDDMTSNMSSLTYVKRVIALPGDTVIVRNNRVSVVNHAFSYEHMPTADVEAIGGLRHLVHLQPYETKHDFGPVKVPDGHYFVLGDNRGHSSDSRFIGMISDEQIIGSVPLVPLSFSKMRNSHVWIPVSLLDK